MIVETPEQLERIFLEVKPSFPEVNPKLRILPATKKRNYLMTADVYETGDILWRKSILGDYFQEQVRGIMAHEFGHLVNQLFMKSFSKMQIEEDKRKYRYDRNYRNEIERAADRTAVQRGFGKDLHFLVYLASFESDCEKYSQEHLTLEEIRELMRRKN